MRNIDYLKLDGHALRQFLAVYDSGSVTAAARQLGIGQSAVSHTLDRLRAVFGDPLFVRQGRGITATDRAHDLAPRVRRQLTDLQNLMQAGAFDPAALSGLITIAADDYERELLGPRLCAQLSGFAPDLNLRFLSPGTMNTSVLRNGQCDLMITPNPPDGTEFMQRKLFTDRWVVFHAPDTPAPQSADAYCARPHAKVVFSDDDTSPLDRALIEAGLRRRVYLQVPSFNALPALMAGTDVITTLPSNLGRTIMQGFATCPPPIAIPPITFYLVWHARVQNSEKSKWLRQMVVQVASDQTQSAPQ